MEIKYAKPTELEPHPLNLKLVPQMTSEEFEALKTDVAEKGIRQPVEVLKGTNKILDGRNRWRAALELELEVPYIEVDIPEEQAALYILERVPVHRNLSVSQRAALAAEYVGLLVDILKTDERRLQNLIQFSRSAKICTSEDGAHRSGKNSTSEGGPKVGRIRELGAKRFGVNHQYVQIAWNLKRLVPESFQLLKAGELSIQDAQGILSRARIEREIAFSYPVLLKRTHHEEANHHSQTHDPRGTKGLPQEARALAKGSCGAFGCRIRYRGGLGNGKEQNSEIFTFHFILPRKRKNSLIFLRNFPKISFLISFSSSKSFLTCSVSEHIYQNMHVI